MKLYLVAAYFFFWCQVSYIFFTFLCARAMKSFSICYCSPLSLSAPVCARSRTNRPNVFIVNSWIVSDHCHHFAYSFSRSINTIVMFVDNEMRVWISIWYTTSSAYWIFNCVTLLREAALPLHSISCLLSLSLYPIAHCLTHRRKLLNILFYFRQLFRTLCFLCHSAPTAFVSS